MKKLSFTAIMLLMGTAYAEVARDPFEIAKSSLLIVILVALLISTIIVSSMKAKLKTAHKQRAAANYIRPNSLSLRVSSDHFLYRTTTRRRVQSSKKN